MYNSNTDADRTNNNIDDRMTKFATQLQNKFVYRIPLRYLCDLGKINFPVKTDIKIRGTLETEMKKLFKSNKRVTTMLTPDVQIVFVKAPFILYEQFLLTKNFRQYLETILTSSNVLWMGIQKTPYQKTYELGGGLLDFTADF